LKRRLTVWAVYVLLAFFTLTVTALIVGLLYVVAVRLQILGSLGRVPFASPLFLLLVSVIFGTIMFAIIGKRAIKYFHRLQDAVRRVTAGDFSVQVEPSKIYELNLFINDFNKMVRSLNSIETLKDDFITNVSHEIKTPISSIEGCLELLKEQTLTDDEMKEYISLMDLSVKRLSVLTSNILRLSKLENQEILSEQNEFFLDEQIRQSILLLERKWSAKNIFLNINLIQTRFIGNKELLMQVWINLIDNAIMFSRTGGEICIELLQTDETVSVKIIDYGIGMSDEVQKHIFQKFYQGNENRSNQGNGLGLALVKRIVELSSGRIDVESSLGEGSIFTVNLPAIKKSAQNK
jgi:signal transduction histidine kinase